MIIKGAEPFFLLGSTQNRQGSSDFKHNNAHGVLLIHGFTGNPAEMLPLGQFLHSCGFTVLAVRLAGHGTSEKDLLRMTKEDWLASTMDGYAILSGCCDKISVIGHSMGALLALNLSLRKKVERLVTMAAPIFIDKSFHIELLPEREQSKGLFIRKRKRNLKNVPLAANHTYRLMPLISVHEILDLIEETKKNLSKVIVPILILHGKEDHTANVESANYIFENVASAQKKIELIEGARHSLPLFEERDMIFEMTVNFLEFVGKVSGVLEILN